MTPNEIYKSLQFSNEFSVDDWNELLEIKLRKYFISDDVFNSNKEVLRTEILNYIQFVKNETYLELFDWTFSIFKDSLQANENLSLTELANSFYEVSATDNKWMTNVLTQPNSSEFSERDKVSYIFKVIDEILEGCFKPRFKLLYKFVAFKETGLFPNNSNRNFGQLIKDFSPSFNTQATLYLKDPVISISTNQWRNIAAHKSFTIEKDGITLEYGIGNITTVKISYEQFYNVFKWVQNIYRILRLSEVLIHLNHTSEIVNILDGVDKIKGRFESFLMHIINNLQIVGFEFVSTEENDNTYEISLKKKLNDDVKGSMIHASQCLEQLSCAITDDEFSVDKFSRAKVKIVDDDINELASATIEVAIAMKKVKGEISLNEYLEKMDFKINNCA